MNDEHNFNCATRKQAAKSDSRHGSGGGRNLGGGTGGVVVNYCDELCEMCWVKDLA